MLIAGKAHPRDAIGKRLLEQLFELRDIIDPEGGRVAFLEDYDLALARQLVSGCDVWVNLPRPPLEASGTSGMKAMFNGCLHLSVLDGWWAEGYNGKNGWGIVGDPDPDLSLADQADADAFYSLVENDVIPLFYDRDADGVPHGWCEPDQGGARHLRPDLHDGADDRRVRDEDLHAAGHARPVRDGRGRRGRPSPADHGRAGANGCSSSSPACTTPQLDSGTAFHAPSQIAERLRDDDARLLRELGEVARCRGRGVELVEPRR